MNSPIVVLPLCWRLCAKHLHIDLLTDEQSYMFELFLYDIYLIMCC
jgi:hypothetical protein